MSNNIIYGLIDPNTDELRYIGQSSIGIRRAQKHCWAYYLKPEAKNGQHSHKQRWILKLFSELKKPNIIILETLNSKEDLNESEIFWISYYKGLGSRLTNTALGGKLSIPPAPRPKGYKHSEETCELISKTLKANSRPRTEEQKQYLRTLRLGKKCGPCPEDRKEKIRIANTGHIPSESQKKNQSKAKDSVKIKIKDQYGNVYDSICDAVRKTGAHKPAIRNQLIGLNRDCKGFLFSKVII